MDLEDMVMSDSEDANGEPLDSSTDINPVENVVAIPVPGLLVIHTLVPVDTPSEFISPSLWESPSPLYIAEHGEDPEHHGVPEYWAKSTE